MGQRHPATKVIQFQIQCLLSPSNEEGVCICVQASHNWTSSRRGCPQNTMRLNIAEIGCGSLIACHIWLCMPYLIHQNTLGTHSHKCVMMTCWPYCCCTSDDRPMSRAVRYSSDTHPGCHSPLPPHTHSDPRDTQAWALFQLAVRPPLLSPSPPRMLWSQFGHWLSRLSQTSWRGSWDTLKYEWLPREQL